MIKSVTPAENNNKVELSLEEQITLELESKSSYRKTLEEILFNQRILIDDESLS